MHTTLPHPHTTPGIDLRVFVFATVLVMALIEFAQAWYFSAATLADAGSRPFGGQFRALLWLCCLGAIFLHATRHGIMRIIVAIGPLAPFVIWGAVGVFVWSVSPVTSIRTLIFWGFAAGIATAAGTELRSVTLARVLAFFFLAVLVGSVVLWVVDPTSATGFWKDQLVFRGLFPAKNLMGWFCALGLVVTFGLSRYLGIIIATITGLLLVAGLLLSGSATALLIAVGVLGYMVWLRFVSTIFVDGTLGFLATVLMMGFALMTAAIAFPFVLDALGRDPTLTGRTDVWLHYLSYIMQNPFSGYGAGLLSGTSALTVAIGGTVRGHEESGLFSAHSIYITLFGEVGIWGVILFTLGLIYIAFVQPFRRRDRWTFLAAGLAFAILVAGLAESRDGYMPGMATILMLAARAQSARMRVPTTARYSSHNVQLSTMNMPETSPPYARV